ncbi:MAG: hypothetical protein QXI32_02450, partial [Candidatus Bathyarchaeia archaeon]
AQRYFFLARQLGMRYKVRIPRQFRFLICRHCKRLLSIGVDARVRIAQRREPHVVITCMFCRGLKRIPLSQPNTSISHKTSIVSVPPNFLKKTNKE